MNIDSYMYEASGLSCFQIYCMEAGVRAEVESRLLKAVCFIQFFEKEDFDS